MGRRSTAPASIPLTPLGVEMAERRGLRSRRAVALEIGIDHAVYHRLEMGQRGPSVSTARALARWLGWSLEQVLDAAEQPPAATEDLTTVTPSN